MSWSYFRELKKRTAVNYSFLKRYRAFLILQNKRGVALLMAMSAIMLLTFIAVEVSYETQLEYLISNNEYHRLKAYYAAKAGMELSLYRILIYQQARATLGAQSGMGAMLDLIWNFPFQWPPMALDNLMESDKDALKKSVANSLMEASYQAKIEAEGSKLDLNDLDSPAKPLADAVHKQLVQVIQTRLLKDDDWARDHQNIKPEEIINNITDWIDKDDESRNGGSEKTLYRDFQSDFID